MNVVGCDCSTYAVDFVFLDETGHAEWRRVQLEGADAWERTRSVWWPSRWMDDTIAAGIEVAHGPSSGQINRVIGAVMSQLPRSLLLQPWTAAQWKKAVGLSGNATKYKVLVHAVDSLGEADTRNWPQDACDAYCIAKATQQALDRSEAA